MHRVVGATPASLVMARPLSIQCIFISFVPTLFSYVLPGEDPVLSFVIVLILIPLNLIFMYIMMTKST